MIKLNQIITQDNDEDFTIFEDREDNGAEFIALKMAIERPSGVHLNTITFRDGNRTNITFGMRFDNDIETIEKLVKWTKSITKQANKQIKKLKEKQELKEEFEMDCY